MCSSYLVTKETAGLCSSELLKPGLWVNNHMNAWNNMANIGKEGRKNLVAQQNLGHCNRQERKD